VGFTSTFKVFNPPYIFLTPHSDRQEGIYNGVQLKYNAVNIDIYCTKYGLPKNTNLITFLIKVRNYEITLQQANLTVQMSGSQIVYVSHNLIFVHRRIKFTNLFFRSLEKRTQRYHDNFWRGKVTCLTNLRDPVRPSAANCWDSKDPSGNLTSINVLTVQQISPHHKLCVCVCVCVCVYHIVWV
jgi:hypothetical protein